MSSKDYMQVNKDGTITVNFNKYTGNAFIDAIKTKDIALVRILDKKTKQAMNISNGSPDVEIIRASGEKGMISRKDLVTNYTYMSGHKIKIAYMKNNSTYRVMCRCNKPYKVMFTPNNMNAYVNGKLAQGGVYVVAPINKTGQADFSRCTIMSSKLFRKQFTIPMQDVIKRNIGKRGSSSYYIRTKGKGQGIVRKPTAFDNITSRSSTMNTYDNQQQAQNVQRRQQPTQQQVQSQQPKYRFKAVGRIVTEQGQLIGYILIDIKGNRQKVSLNKVYQLCQAKQIQNLKYVSNANGQGGFLQGNGMSIQSIPQFLP